MESNIRRLHRKTEHKCPLCGSDLHIVYWNPPKKTSADMKTSQSNDVSELTHSENNSALRTPYSLMCLNCSFGFNYDG